MWPGRFIAGNSIKHVISVSHCVLNQFKQPIINYAIEDCDNSKQVFEEHMRLISQLYYKYKLAI